MRIALLALATALQVAAIPVAQDRPPNIVIVLADDLGFGDPQCYAPASMIPTPRIDALGLQDLRR